MSLTVDQEARPAEVRSVEAWRLLTLLDAGYPAEIAEWLAQRTYVDLHRAVELRERGCASELAFRILT
jgi:hypothetical protein